MTRIKDLKMTVRDVIITMSGGNPGAMTACMELTKETPKIDPDAAMGGLGTLLSLDMLGIYDSRLYMLWNDVCNRNVADMLAVLRADQMGQLAGVTATKINYAIDNRGKGLDLKEIMKAVQKELPRFNITPTHTEVEDDEGRIKKTARKER
jgi:hypothetical protein